MKEQPNLKKNKIWLFHIVIA